MNWYIEKTTSKGRSIIRGAVFGIFADLERAEVLLETVLEESFLESEQKPLTASEADWTRSMLYIVHEIIGDAVVAYHLTVGDTEDLRAKNYIASAETAKLAMQCESAHSGAVAAGNKLCEDRRRVFIDAMDKISDMWDAEAIAAIDGLVKNGGKNG